MKVTVTYYCPNMIDEEAFKEEFDSDPQKCWDYCVGEEPPMGYGDIEEIVNIEVVEQPE